MIKFFRKIRQNLLLENKKGTYFKYAIGEIAMVVIGILIALQINNWNEQKKLSGNVNGIYSIIESDLVGDIKQIDDVLKSMTRRDGMFQRILKKEITQDEYKNYTYCAGVLNGFLDFTLNNRGVNLLNNNLTSFHTNQDSLLIKVNKFYSYFNIEIEVAMQEITMDYNDNRYYFKNNKAWFEDYQNNVINDDFIKYALESQDYRNRVNSFYRLYFEVYLTHLKNYQEEALLIIKDIDKKLK